MPNPTPDIPEEAVEALARRNYTCRHPHWDELPASQKAPLLANARLDLEAAAPSIRKQERERVRGYADDLRARAAVERYKKAPDFSWAEQLEGEAASVLQALDSLEG